MGKLPRRAVLRMAMGALGATGLSALAGCNNRPSGEQGGMPTVGFVQFASTSALDTIREGYLAGFADAGFKDGETMRIDLKNAEGDVGTLQLILQDFASRNLNLIATASSQALQAAIKATDTTPVVFAGVADPFILGAGTAPDDHKPNVTGIMNPHPLDECLRLAVQIMPNVRRFGSLYDPSEPFVEQYQAMAQKTAAELNVEWIGVSATGPNDVVTGVQGLQSRGAGAIVQIPSNTIWAGIEGLIQQGLSLRMPLFSVDTTHSNKGALLAYGIDFRQAGYDASQIAARILKGEKPAEIPIEPVKKRQMVLNAETARKLNMTFPEAVLSRADEVLGQDGAKS